MADTKQMLRRLDALPSPDVWDDARRRIPGDGEGDASAGHPKPVVRRVVAGAVAVAVFSAAAWFGWIAFRGTTSTPAPVPADLGWTTHSSGWTELPSPPTVRDGATWVSTDADLIVWGGSTGGDEPDTSAEGERFDAETSTWSPIPEAPEGRDGALGVWTGSEIFYWGGLDDDGRYVDDGFRFDLETQAWTPMPAAPLQPAFTAVAIWSGSELIVWGGGEPGSDRSQLGAAFDPATDTWRRIARAPIGLTDAHGVWTGREMIVFGSSLDGRNLADTEHAIGARYDPVADRWRELPPSRLSPQASAIAYTGDELVAYDYLVRAQTYAPQQDRWSEVSRLPLEPSECYPDLVTSGSTAFAFYCGDAATYEPGVGWEPVTGGMLDETFEVGGTEYRLFRFATIVPVEDGLVFAAEGITQADTGEVCYGCPGSPHALWLWRP